MMSNDDILSSLKKRNGKGITLTISRLSLDAVLTLHLQLNFPTIMTDQVEIIAESLKRHNVSFSGTFSLVLPLSDRKVPDTRVTLPLVNTVNRHL